MYSKKVSSWFPKSEIGDSVEHFDGELDVEDIGASPTEVDTSVGSMPCSSFHPGLQSSLSAHCGSLGHGNGLNSSWDREGLDAH